MRYMVLAILASAIMMSEAQAGDPFPDKISPNVVVPKVQFGSFGGDANQLNEPGAVAISDSNEIYIAECYNNRIQVFDQDGKSKRQWNGSSEGSLVCPQGVA